MKMAANSLELRVLLRSLNKVFNSMTLRQCTFLHQIFTKEQADECLASFMESFFENDKFKGLLEKSADKSKEAQELLYKTAEENMRNLINRALARNVRIQNEFRRQFIVQHPLSQQLTAEQDAQTTAKVKQRQAEKLDLQQALSNTASETVEDLFQSAANNYARSNSGEQRTELVNEKKESSLRRSWRKFFRRVDGTNEQQKKDKPGLFSRLRRSLNLR
ncbi:uncharacterized protein LOC134238201 [Saccostrea cucullata]|uniref:uncharacterized protein LOC134238201 n=1 Tax=Saccostrea cuccullata TaxID=36930 RepID=UPI002ED54179